MPKPARVWLSSSFSSVRDPSALVKHHRSARPPSRPRVYSCCALDSPGSLLTAADAAKIIAVSRLRLAPPLRQASDKSSPASRRLGGDRFRGPPSPYWIVRSTPLTERRMQERCWTVPPRRYSKRTVNFSAKKVGPTRHAARLRTQASTDH